MDTGDIQKNIIEIIAARMGMSVTDIVSKGITLESSFSELKIDSLLLVEVVMDIEEKFKIEIPDADAAKLAKIADVVKYVEQCCATSESAGG